MIGAWAASDSGREETEDVVEDSVEDDIRLGVEDEEGARNCRLLTSRKIESPGLTNGEKGDGKSRRPGHRNRYILFHFSRSVCVSLPVDAAMASSVSAGTEKLNGNSSTEHPSLAI